MLVVRAIDTYVSTCCTAGPHGIAVHSCGRRTLLLHSRGTHFECARDGFVAQRYLAARGLGGLHWCRFGNRLLRGGDSARISVRVSEVELHGVHRASSGSTDNVPSLSSMPFESTVVDLHDGTYAVEICCFAVRLLTHFVLSCRQCTHSTRSVRSSLLSSTAKVS